MPGHGMAGIRSEPPKDPSFCIILYEWYVLDRFVIYKDILYSYVCMIVLYYAYECIIVFRYVFMYIPLYVIGIR